MVEVTSGMSAVMAAADFTGRPRGPPVRSTALNLTADSLLEGSPLVACCARRSSASDFVEGACPLRKHRSLDVGPRFGLLLPVGGVIGRPFSILEGACQQKFAGSLSACSKVHGRPRYRRAPGFGARGGGQLAATHEPARAAWIRDRLGVFL